MRQSHTVVDRFKNGSCEQNCAECSNLTPRKVSIGVGMASVCGNRSNNDDYAAFDLEQRAFVIADGIGGAPYGDIMARIACNRALAACSEAREDKLTRFDLLKRILEDTDATVSDAAKWLGRLGSGTTLTIGVIEDGFLCVAAVGDSRCYRQHKGEFECITGGGRSSTDDKALNSALGYRMNLDVRYRELSIEEGDTFLYCTDGVWDTQTNDSLAQCLFENKVSPQETARLIVSKSDMSDNATALVLSVIQCKAK